MKTLFKAILIVIGIIFVVIVGAFAYLNFIYLPQKVKTSGPAFLQEKSRGQIKAESIQYVPFKGIKLDNTTIFSKAQEPLITFKQLYCNVYLWSLITTRNELKFNLSLSLPKIEKPLVFEGLYQIKPQRLDLDWKMESDLFAQKQTIYGKAGALISKEEKTQIDLSLESSDLNVQCNFYIKDRDLQIEKFSGKILDSTFDLIGDIQNLSSPSLNIYTTVKLDLKSLSGINPKYALGLEKIQMDGRCDGEIYLAQQANNPEVGLKLNAAQIQIEKTGIENLLLVAKMKNKEITLSSFYAKLYYGEIKLDGTCKLDKQGFPATLNLNVFNLELNNIIADITGKDTPIHGRLFSLAKLKSPLRDPKAVEGTLWISVSGSNILQIPLLGGITEILKFPQMRKIEFKEASGNFAIAKQAARTEDFKIISDNLVIHYKGYIDFAGNISFDVDPVFSANFLATPSIGNILGIFIDSAGNFMGEIKLKGNVKDFRHTFKPFSKEGIFPQGIEEGLKQLFKRFQEKEE